MSEVRLVKIYEQFLSSHLNLLLERPSVRGYTGDTTKDFCILLGVEDNTISGFKIY